MSGETKQRILEEGARLIHRQGFNATGIKQILDAAGVPKGSFYFYFGNKEEFGLAVVDHFEAMFRERVMETLVRDEGGPLQRLQTFFALFDEYFAREGYSLGCPIGNLSQELGDVSPVFRQRLHRSLRGLIKVVARVLAEARGLGELPKGLDPESTAMFVVESWHGALVHMKAAKSGAPLEVWRTMVFGRLLGLDG